MFQVSLTTSAIRRSAGRMALMAIVWLLIASLALPPFLIPGAALATGTIYVNAGESIQAAINAASPGDTIVVGAGEYQTNLVIDKSLTLRSAEGPESTTIMAADPGGNVIEVRASNVVIEGFSIAGASGDYASGILTAAWANADNNRFSGNNIYSNFFGVSLDSSSDGSTVSGNYFHDNQAGVYIHSATLNTVADNLIAFNYFGIYTDYGADNNTVKRNYVYYNSFAFYVPSGAGNRIYLNDVGGGQDNMGGGATWSSPSPLTYSYYGLTYSGFLGNYWEGYSGSDAMYDGVGDSAHPVDLGASDLYPLMEPFENYLLGLPPSQPENMSPSNGATGIGLTPTLQSSAFSDPDVEDTHQASHWQITMDPGWYSSTIFDSDFDSSNLTSINIVDGILSADSTYYWRVRHQDSNGAWSEWSPETSFSTQSSAYFDLAVNWQWTQTDWSTSQEIGLAFEVHNLGNADSPPFTVRWELDGATMPTSASFDAFPPLHNGGGMFEYYALAGLAEGTNHTFTVFIELPAGQSDSDLSNNDDPNVIFLTQPVALPAPANLVKTSPDNDDTPSFEWDAVPGAAFYEVSFDSGSYQPVEGAASFTVPALVDGHHYILVRAVDDSGERGPDAFLEFIIDTTPPVISGLLPEDGATLTDRWVYIQAGFSDSLSRVNPESVQFRLDGSDITAGSGIGPNYVSYEAALGFGLHSVELYVSDNAGNIAQAAWSFTIAGGHTWELPAGWSMISLPVIPENPDPDAIFGARYYILYTWDNAAGVYVQPEVMEPGVAYWILLLEPASISLSGTPLESYIISLPQGWNMIGATANPMRLQDATVEPAGALFHLVYVWYPELNMYVVTDYLEPGQGYWALALQDLTLTVTPPLPPGSIS